MKCFDHQQEEAVGICNACNKGLCAKCAVPLGFAITCKGDCESHAVMRHTQMHEAHATNLAVQRNRYLNPAIYGLISMVLLIIEVSQRGWRFAPMVLFGLCILVLAVYMLSVSYRWGREYGSEDEH